MILVGGYMPLVGSPKVNWSQVRGQTKRGSKPSMAKKKNKDLCTRPGGLPGPRPGATTRRRSRAGPVQRGSGDGLRWGLGDPIPGY